MFSLINDMDNKIDIGQSSGLLLAQRAGFSQVNYQLISSTSSTKIIG